MAQTSWSVFVARFGRRSVALVLSATTLVVGVAGTATAGDNAGIFSFFSRMGQDEAPRAEPAPAPQPTWSPPALTIRKTSRQKMVFRHVRAPVVARFVPAHVQRVAAKVASPVTAVPGRPVQVSIYEDPTLRRGDAVMTDHGLRIFLGSKSFPYQQADFRAIGTGSGISDQYRKALIEIDQRVPSAG